VNCCCCLAARRLTMPKVLRHEIPHVLRRANSKPGMGWANRVVFVALIRKLPQTLRRHRLSPRA
jgi:hypothetical protein